MNRAAAFAAAMATLRDAAVRAGATLFQPAEVTDLRTQGETRICGLDDGREIAAPVVIAACGSWNPKGIFAVRARASIRAGC